MKNVCRNCKHFMYHRFAGYCTKKHADTYDCSGNCKACENFAKRSKEEEQNLLRYEEDVLKPFFKM